MHPRRQPHGAEPARLHPRRQPDDPGGLAAVAARDGRRGRRGLSGLDAGRPAGVAALGAGGGRRARSWPRCRSRASGWPTTCSCSADGRELVLRRWARPGWELDDPDLTAAREALVLERLAGTPVPAPELVAADPDAAACDVAGAAHHARARARRPGAPAARAARRRRWPRSTPSIPPASRPTGATTSPTAWRCRRGPADRERVGARDRAGPCAAARRCPSASSTATSIPATRCGRAPSSPAWSTGPPARAGPAAVDLGHLRWNLALDYGQRVADALLPHPEHHPVLRRRHRARRPARARRHLHARRAAAPRGARARRALAPRTLRRRETSTRGGRWAAPRVITT